MAFWEAIACLWMGLVSFWQILFIFVFRWMTRELRALSDPSPEPYPAQKSTEG